jgi:hypothetical protein
MIIPLCSGMERSASTLAWQVVKCLVPVSRPLNWEPGCEVKKWTGHPQDWPIKRHDYMTGNRPVIFTYRNPAEAFLSLRRCFKSDIGKKIDQNDEYAFEQLTPQEADMHAMRLILEAEDVYNQYKRDRDDGRSVLFLKYEDYYDYPRKRIKDISVFLLIYRLRDDEVDQIIEYTDIKKNAERAINAGNSFHDSRDESHGMQGQHINTETWGKPGTALKKYAPFVEQIIKDPDLAPLKKMCENLGYEL